MAATFTIKIYADTLRKDGSYNIKIRVVNGRTSTKAETPFFATKKDLKRNSLELNNQIYIDGIRKIINRWTVYLSDMDGAECVLTAAQLVKYFKKRDRERFEVKEEAVFKLDFVKFGFEVAEMKSPGTKRGYVGALNALERFLNGRALDVNGITPAFLQSFEDFIKGEPVLKYSRKDGLVKSDKSKAEGRAASLYVAHIRHIFNEARRLHNYQNGVINIPGSPFDNYKLAKLPRRKKRSISLDILQRLIDLPDKEVKDGVPVEVPRRDMVRDCFLLSFALAGMNAADLYDCPADALVYDDINKAYVVVYNRKKTRTRREDEAEMHIRVEPCILPLLEKYKDPEGKQLFNFANRYCDENGFNVALRQGILQICKDFKLPHFTFYSGRHTWATVGRSREVNIDKYTIHEGLNHVDEKMKVTDIYIRRDYSVIWEANAKILAQLDWSGLLRREESRNENRERLCS